MFTWRELYERYVGTYVPPEPGTLRLPSYNVAPTQQVPIVRSVEGQRELSAARWGLVPFFAKGVPLKFPMINTRMEDMEQKPSWRGPWKRGHRCIIPTSGFYEWQGQPSGGKIPFFISVAGEPVFGLAGIWDHSEGEAGAIDSCSIITMPANPLVADIHNQGANPHRMPAILRASDYDSWLSGTLEQARALLQPFPADEMLAWPVSSRVNSPKNNDADLVQRQV